MDKIIKVIKNWTLFARAKPARVPVNVPVNRRQRNILSLFEEKGGFFCQAGQWWAGLFLGDEALAGKGAS